MSGRRSPVRAWPALLALALLAVPAAATGDLEARRFEAAYHFAVGKILAEDGSLDEARQAYELALELDGSDPYARLELAKLFADVAGLSRTRDARYQHLEEAANQASLALRMAPENVDVLRAYGQIHLSLAERNAASLAQAQRAFEDLRTKVEGDLQVLVSLGQIYLWQRRFPDAADALREARRYRPGHRMLDGMLLDALIGSDALDEAEPLLVALLEREPNSLDHRLQLAEVYSQRDEAPRALAVLEAAPASMHDNPGYRELLAVVLHQLGEDARALTLVDELLAAFPERPNLRRLRISVLSALARYDDAIAELEIAVAADDNPFRVDQLLVLGRLLERVDRADQAGDRLRQALDAAAGTDRLRLQLSLAGILERQGRAQQAIAQLAAALPAVDDGNLVLVARSLAELHQRAGDLDAGMAVLETAIERLETGGNAAAADHLRLRRLGLLAAAERWTELAIQAAAQRKAPDPDLRLAARVAEAEALARLDRLDDALALLAVADAGPDQRRTVQARRVALQFAGGREEAAAAEVAGIAAGGELDDLLFAAQLWQQAERYREAIPLLETVVAARPSSTRALFALAASHERTGDYPRAANVFETLLAQDPDHAQALNYLGYMWAERGENLDRALALIQRAVALDPDNGAYVDSLGWAHFQRGDFDQARRLLEWAARLIGDDPTIYEHLGDLYVALEQPERARQSYRQALALEADQEQVQRKLEQLDRGDRSTPRSPGH